MLMNSGGNPLCRSMGGILSPGAIAAKAAVVLVVEYPYPPPPTKGVNASTTEVGQLIVKVAAQIIRALIIIIIMVRKYVKRNCYVEEDEGRYERILIDFDDNEGRKSWE